MADHGQAIYSVKGILINKANLEHIVTAVNHLMHKLVPAYRIGGKPYYRQVKMVWAAEWRDLSRPTRSSQGSSPGRCA